MSQPLASSAVAQYRDQGYVVVPDLLGPAEVERYRERAAQIARGDHPPAAASRIMRNVEFAKGLLPMPADPERAVWKILNPDRFDGCFAQALRIPRLIDAVASLIGDDVLAFLLQLIYKPPGVAESVHPFHQDGLYFPFEPHDGVLGAWIALDPVHRENGTLCVLPGSHRSPISEHAPIAGANKNALGASGVEGVPGILEQAVHFELPPGAGVLFHPHLYHRTAGNRTDGHRRVLALHFASARCRATGSRVVREYAFTSVRGRTYEGCLQPLDAPDLAFQL